MVKFTRILYPTDLSTAAAPGLGFALSLARWYSASLTVLHVVPTFDALQVAPEAIGESAHLVYPPAPDVVAAEIRTQLGLDDVTDVDLHVLAEAGDAETVILDQALSLGANLIIMGTHGRRGFDRLWHGSVTDRVLQRTPCPVLTVPPHSAPAPDEGIFTRILCPIDFSSSSQQAFGFALDLASQSAGTMTALHVLEWMTDYEPAPFGPFTAADYRRHLITDAEQRLRTLVDGVEHPWCEVTPVVATGRSHREILQTATDMRANLIVMGAQGRGGVGTPIVGATTHQIVRAAECPVLVVRPV